VVPGQARDLDAVSQGCERVAQFVGEGGEKLGLATIHVAQGQLGILAFADVDVHADALEHRPVRAEQRHGFDVGPAPGAVRMLEPELRVDVASFANAFRPVATGELPVLGMDGVDPATAEPLLQALPGVSAPRGRIELHDSCGVGFPDGLRDGFDQQAQAYLTLPQSLLRPATLDQVRGLARDDVEQAHSSPHIAGLLILVRRCARRHENT
jgi:hypothetical protein